MNYATTIMNRFGFDMIKQGKRTCKLTYMLTLKIKDSGIDEMPLKSPNSQAVIGKIATNRDFHGIRNTGIPLNHNLPATYYKYHAT